MTRSFLACLLIFWLGMACGEELPAVGWEQHPGAKLPLDLPFVDETGRAVRLQDYFGRAPVVVVFVYLSCARLCPETIQGIGEALEATGLEPGRDYRVLALSIDPADTPAKATQHRSHTGTGPGILAVTHFLTSAAGSTSQVARVAGFHFLRDPTHEQFAHAAGFLIATPEGVVSRYLFGVRYEAGALRSALMSAQSGKIGGLTERLRLLCAHLEPLTARHSLGILRSLRIAALLLIAVALAVWLRPRRIQP